MQESFYAHERIGLDREILTYTSLLRAVGYKMEAGPRDIGVTANGSPLFVDPGTLAPMTPFICDTAFKKLMNGLNEFGVGDLFYWQPQTLKAPLKSINDLIWACRR